MEKPTLTRELEQFLYTHMQGLPFKKQLLQVVKSWEEAYIQRIEELERQIQDSARMASEAPTPRYRAPYDPDDDDSIGNRYGDGD